MKTISSRDGANGFSLRTKMVLLSAIAFAGILLMACISLMLVSQVRIGGSAYQSIQKDKDSLENLAMLKADLFQINSEMQSFMLETDTAAARNNVAAIKKLTKNIDQNFAAVLALIQSPQKKEALNKTQLIWKDYQKTLLEEVLPAIEKGEILKASYLATGVQATRFVNFSSSISKMVDMLRKDVNATELQVAESIQSKIISTVAMSVVLIGVIALFSILITNSITRPLKECVDFARTVASGTLTNRLSVTAGGEIASLAEAMNTMAENLQNMVSRVNSASGVLTSIDNSISKAARQVVTSAHLQAASVNETSLAVAHINESIREVTDGVEKLACSATETSSSTLEMAASIEEVAMSADKLGDAVDEVSSSIVEMAASLKEIGSSIVNLLDASSMTASSIAEMDATIKQVEKNAMDTSAITEVVRQDAETGKMAVQDAIAGMQAIRNASRITADVIENLSLRANDIGAILSVIDEVAEQTNLLALNAAIIAAQAGEHGKGFAVVADEIRELAERTSSSTREIATVIKGVQEETSRAVIAINQAEESISDGEKRSQHSGSALEKIVSGVQRASDQVHEIARATVEQARGSQSIKEAMESVENMVEHIANSAREHARGSDLISTAVERMKDLTGHVRISTREQSRASGLIAQSTENVTSMIDQIRDACHSQLTNSTMILKSVRNIQQSTTSNTESVAMMENSVAGLSKQIDLLEKEMSGFTL